jgi:hypothetical protein
VLEKIYRHLEQQHGAAVFRGTRTLARMPRYTPKITLSHEVNMSISVSIIGASGAVGTTLATHILRSDLLGP